MSCKFLKVDIQNSFLCWQINPDSTCKRKLCIPLPFLPVQLHWRKPECKFCTSSSSVVHITNLWWWEYVTLILTGKKIGPFVQPSTIMPKHQKQTCELGTTITLFQLWWIDLQQLSTDNLPGHKHFSSFLKSFHWSK